ncbi:MAG: class II fructose-bisphosphate aldolase, partial [Verrucomicrobiota bacterium]
MLLTPPQARALYEHAVSHRYAVLAVNADSPAAIVDCLLAAKECEAPVIIETSLWQLTGHSFGAGDPTLGIDRYLATLRTLAESGRFQDVPVIYHTDHIKGPDTLPILRHAMEENASSISLDSSEMTEEENVETLSALCRFALESGLEATLEMEAGVDDGITPLSETRSLFGQIEERHPGFLALWAPGVGTCHGLGSDPQAFSPEAVREHRELASDLAGRPIGIALHGSSGLDPRRLAEAVAAGVAKVNWSSESLLIRSQAARAFYAEKGDQLEKGQPDFKETAMDNGVQKAVSQVYVPRVVDRIRSLHGEGQGTSFLNTLFS